MKQKKTAMITGTTSGIGYELTKLFAKDGYNLVLISIDKQKLMEQKKEIQKKYKINVYIIDKDLSENNAAGEIFKELQQKSIHIDILVNNAGFNECGSFYETNLEKELKMIKLHINSVTKLTKLFLPGMLKNKFGKILNIASTGAFTPLPFDAVYGATKAYLYSFSEALAVELVDKGITVTTLCPGATRTAFAKKAGIEDTRLFNTCVMEAEKVAKIGYYSMMKGKRVVIAGLFNKLLVLSSKFAPQKILDKVSKKIWEKV